MNEMFVPSFLRDGQDPIKHTDYTNNGLIFNGIPIPEEMFVYILSCIDVKHLLNCSLVCRRWNQHIKSYVLWSTIYKRKYLYYSYLTTDYFNKNIIINDDKSMNKIAHWKCHIVQRSRNEFIISPCEGSLSSETIPVMILNTHLKVHRRIENINNAQVVQSDELWLIKLSKNKLFQYIIDQYKPYIYVKYCGSVYELQYGLFNERIDSTLACVRTRRGARIRREGTNNQRTKYEEAEITIEMYPKGIRGIVFEAMHYNNYVSSGLSEGIVMFLFESISDESAATIHPEEIQCRWNIIPPS